MLFSKVSCFRQVMAYLMAFRVTIDYQFMYSIAYSPLFAKFRTLIVSPADYTFYEDCLPCQVFDYFYFMHLHNRKPLYCFETHLWMRASYTNYLHHKLRGICDWKQTVCWPGGKISIVVTRINFDHKMYVACMDREVSGF